MTTNERSIGKMIRTVRLTKSMSLALLAKRLSITVNDAGKMELGQIEMTMGTIASIAAVLDVPLSTFFVERNYVVPKEEKFSEANLLRSKLQQREEELTELRYRLIDLYEKRKAL